VYGFLLFLESIPLPKKANHLCLKENAVPICPGKHVYTFYIIGPLVVLGYVESKINYYDLKDIDICIHVRKRMHSCYNCI
jgi:hypothetical protein